MPTSGDSASAMLLEFHFKRDSICQLSFLTKEMPTLPSFLVIRSWPGKESPAALLVAPRTVKLLGGECRHSVPMKDCEERAGTWWGWEGVTENGKDTGLQKLRWMSPASCAGGCVAVEKYLWYLSGNTSHCVKSRHQRSKIVGGVMWWGSDMSPKEVISVHSQCL